MSSTSNEFISKFLPFLAGSQVIPNATHAGFESWSWHLTTQSCLLVFHLIKISITTRKKVFVSIRKQSRHRKTWTRLERIKPDYKWIKLSLSRLICVSVSAHWNRSKKVLEAFFRDISRDGWILWMLFSCIIVWQRGRGVSGEQKWHDWTKILHLWPFVVVRPSALT